MDQRSKPTDSPDVYRAEYLLSLLAGVQHDPSPALRERLEILSSQRLRDGVEAGKPLGSAWTRLLLWRRPVSVIALLVAIGTIAAFVVYVRQPERMRTRIESRVSPPLSPFSSGSRAQAEAPSQQAKSTTTRHSPSKLAHNNTTRRMIVRLPYSNSAIDTGTDATIRVSMSQAELVSLGFPMNSALRDRRVVAELTLGDDGLPRAVSVPLPLEVIREKK